MRTVETADGGIPAISSTPVALQASFLISKASFCLKRAHIHNPVHSAQLDCPFTHTSDYCCYLVADYKDLSRLSPNPLTEFDYKSKFLLHALGIDQITFRVTCEPAPHTVS